MKHDVHPRLTDAALRDIAAEADAAFSAGPRQAQPFTARYPDLTMNDAYRITALANGMRVAKGYRPVGRKIGFTNRRIWDEYGVHAPVWGYIYDRTLHDLAAPFPLAAFAESKIEPEIMLGLSRAPSPGMDDTALLTCIDWVAHGYEIVQSIYPGWKFAPPDAVIVDGYHGALLVGPLNVLEGPVSTLRYLMDLLARDPDNPPLAAGEIVSTGTLTRALPVRPGETWTTKLKGIALEDASLRFE